MPAVAHVAGKGLGLVAARHVRAGEVILSDCPLLVTPAWDCRQSFCCNCLRSAHAGGQVWRCDSCSNTVFCSPQCKEASRLSPHCHNPAICRLTQLLDFSGLDGEQSTTLTYLVQVLTLRIAAGIDEGAHARWREYAAICPRPPAIHPLTCPLYARLQVAWQGSHGLAKEDVAAALHIDAAFAFGIMTPYSPGGGRRLRGSAVYPNAARLNHDCLPNCARSDDFDAPCAAPPPANARLRVVALHDVPAGEELTMSYFPLDTPLGERQERCQQEYGFACVCLRCKEEATWASDADEDDEDEDMAGEPSAGLGPDGPCPAAALPQSTAAAPQPDMDAAYIDMFLLKFMCPNEECHGTLVPQQGTDVAVCDTCRLQRSEADFVAELQTLRAQQ